MVIEKALGIQLVEKLARQDCEELNALREELEFWADELARLNPDVLKPKPDPIRPGAATPEPRP